MYSHLPYLKLNRRLSTVNFTSTTTSDLLCLTDLVSYGLNNISFCMSVGVVYCSTNLEAEVLKSVSLNSVDAEF